jgi:hypothetical protein
MTLFAINDLTCMVIVLYSAAMRYGFIGAKQKPTNLEQEPNGRKR